MPSSHSFVNLTPTIFLERSGRAFGDREAIVDSNGSVSFKALLSRARRLASLLEDLGLKYGDRVGTLSDNSLQTIEAHFAIESHTFR